MSQTNRLEKLPPADPAEAIFLMIKMMIDTEINANKHLSKSQFYREVLDLLLDEYNDVSSSYYILSDNDYDDHWDD